MINFMRVFFALVLAAGVQSCGAADSNKTTTAGGAPSSDPKAVVARVNGADITRQELDTATKPMRSQFEQAGRTLTPEQAAQMDRGVLDELITKTVLLDAARKQDVKGVEEQVKDRMERIKAQNGGDEGLKKALAQANLTEADLIKNLSEMVLINQFLKNVVEAKAAVTDEDLKKYYDDHRDQFKQPEQVRASHVLILVPAGSTDDVKKEKKAKIDATRERLVKGEDFAVVAKEVSEDPGSAAQGGDLGFFGRGMMVPEFEKAAFSLKAGEISEVVTTQYGHHILKVTGNKPAGEIPLEEAREQLRQFLVQQKSETVAEAQIAELRQAAKIDVLLPQAVPAVSQP
jgi:peptidyl-prolyl cis-trans isomerase C